MLEKSQILPKDVHRYTIYRICIVIKLCTNTQCMSYTFLITITSAYDITHYFNSKRLASKSWWKVSVSWSFIIFILIHFRSGIVFQVHQVHTSQTTIMKSKMPIWYGASNVCCKLDDTNQFWPHHITCNYRRDTSIGYTFHRFNHGRNGTRTDFKECTHAQMLSDKQQSVSQSKTK